jgi:beta-lactamase superfamily II metal-dependent hydrolase
MTFLSLKYELILFLFCGSVGVLGETDPTVRDQCVFQPMDAGRTVYRNDEALNVSVPLTNLKPGEFELIIKLQKSNAETKQDGQTFKFQVVQPQRATLLENIPANQDYNSSDILRIFAINVNEETIGDAFLILSPSGKTMLIDAGMPGYGKSVILPFLKQHEIKTIDYLVCSHPHSDHMGGMAEVILSKDVAVKHFLWSTVLPFEELKKLSNDFGKGEVETYQALKAACAERNLPLEEVHEGQVLDLGHNVKIEILASAKPEIKVPNYINNNSIIMQLRYGKFTMMFTGDAGYEEENRVFAKGKDLTSDILKAGHHAGAGSTSIPWMHALDAKVAIAPMPAWLSKDPRGVRVENQIRPTRIKFYRTWEYGHIEIQSDGTRFWLMTEKTPGILAKPKEEPYLAPVVDKVIYQFPLVWRFKTDPKGVGLTESEWKIDAAWKPIRVDKDWTSQCYKYHGVGWYMIGFEIPQAIQSKARVGGTKLSLFFGAIDGTADVFLDGRWIGEQKRDVGMMWDKAFAIPLPADFDVTIPHRLTVRVQKDNFAAGIWKAVSIVITH